MKYESGKLIYSNITGLKRELNHVSLEKKLIEIILAKTYPMIHYIKQIRNNISITVVATISK